MAGATPNNAPITKILRTPESRFDNLPGWHWGKPQYFTSKLFNAEIQIAYWDLGIKIQKKQCCYAMENHHGVIYIVA